MRMRIKRLFLILGFLCLACSVKANTVTIVTLGDSNTDPNNISARGGGDPWPTTLVSQLSEAFPGTTYELYNEGLSGQTIGQLVAALSTQLSGSASHPDIVAVMIGTNTDTSSESPVSGYWGYNGTAPNYTDMVLVDSTAIDAYDQVYWPEIVRYIQGLTNGNPSRNGGKPLILVMSPPPAANYPAELSYSSEIGAAVADGSTVASYIYCRPRRNLLILQSKCQALATANNFPFADIYANISGQNNWLSTLIWDGLHLDIAGRGYTATAALNALIPYLDSNGMVKTTPVPPTVYPAKIRNLGSGSRANIRALGQGYKIQNSL